MAEITALGKAALVIPYPYAIGDHQALNAQVLEEAGAVKILPDAKLANGALIGNILELVENPAQVRDMAGKSQALGKPHAARTIACDLLRFERSRS